MQILEKTTPISPGGPTLPGLPGAPFSPFSPGSPLEEEEERREYEENIESLLHFFSCVCVCERQHAFESRDQDLNSAGLLCQMLSIQCQ